MPMHSLLQCMFHNYLQAARLMALQLLVRALSSRPAWTLQVCIVVTALQSFCSCALACAGTLHSLAACKGVPTTIISYDVFKASNFSDSAASLLNVLTHAGVTGLHQPTEADIAAAFTQHMLPARDRGSQGQASSVVLTASQVSCAFWALC